MRILELKKKIKYTYLYSVVYQNLKRYWQFNLSKINKILNRSFIPDHKNIIYIENTSKCNLKCKFCGYPKRNLDDHPLVDMDLENIKNYVDQAKKMGFKNIGLTPVTGDIFMDKKIYDKFNYLEENKINFQFFTNFILAKQERLYELFDYNHLKELHISIYGHDEESFIKFTESNSVSYKKLIKNLTYLESLLATKNKNFILLIGQRTSKDFFLSKDNSELSRILKKIIQNHKINYQYEFAFNNWGGLIKEDDIANLNIQFNKKPVKKIGACSLIFAKNIIGANGNLNACACRDANFTLNIGNLNNDNLEDILSKKNDKYMQLIKDQENGNFPEVCKTCDFYDSIYLNKKITRNVKSLINKKEFFTNL